MWVLFPVAFVSQVVILLPVSAVDRKADASRERVFIPLNVVTHSLLSLSLSLPLWRALVCEFVRACVCGGWRGACVRACMCVCVRACVRACVRVCVCVWCNVVGPTCMWGRAEG